MPIFFVDYCARDMLRETNGLSLFAELLVRRYRDHAYLRTRTALRGPSGAAILAAVGMASGVEDAR